MTSIRSRLRGALAIMLSLALVLSECPQRALRSIALAGEGDVANLTFDSGGEVSYPDLSDPELNRYIEDSVYNSLVASLDDETLFVENVQAVYVSKEYLEELEYNSQANIFFGYTLEELEACFQGTRYVFTLGEDGQTDVVPFEGYDDTYDQVVRNVAIGTGVILLCVTVSVVSAGAGAPAVSMIFAMSAKTGTAAALSSGAIGGVAAEICTGVETGDFTEATKAAALAASESFKMGAIGGAIAGGATEALALHGATLGGLSMNEAAIIQRESKYPLDVIREFNSMEQYQIAKEAGLTTHMVDGKTALIRDIDLTRVDEFGRTNLERMRKGLAALDSSGNAYELHHAGQQADGTLAILTRFEHRQGGNYKIWHLLDESDVDHGNAWKKTREAFWKAMAKTLA